MIRYIIKRYDLLGDPPTRRCVGFNIYNDETDKHEYVEYVIKLSDIEGMDEYEVCKLAFSNLEDKIKRAEENVSKSTLVGTDFVP